MHWVALSRVVHHTGDRQAERIKHLKTVQVGSALMGPTSRRQTQPPSRSITAGQQQTAWVSAACWVWLTAQTSWIVTTSSINSRRQQSCSASAGAQPVCYPTQTATLRRVLRLLQW